MQGPSQARQSGSSLVEVLVTVVVLSIGLLGLAALQLYGMQNANSSGQRLVATTLGYDILERMRANRPAALAGAYTISFGDEPGGGSPAADDLAAWKAALSMLPGGDGSIAVSGREVTITIRWDDLVTLDATGDEPAMVHLRTDL